MYICAHMRVISLEGKKQAAQSAALWRTSISDTKQLVTSEIFCSRLTSGVPFSLSTCFGVFFRDKTRFGDQTGSLVIPPGRKSCSRVVWPTVTAVKPPSTKTASCVAWTGQPPDNSESCAAGTRLQLLSGFFSLLSPDVKTPHVILCLRPTITPTRLVNKMAGPRTADSLLKGCVFLAGRECGLHTLRLEASMGGFDFHRELAGLPFQLKRISRWAFDDKGSVFSFFFVPLCFSPAPKRIPASRQTENYAGASWAFTLIVFGFFFFPCLPQCSRLVNFCKHQHI